MDLLQVRSKLESSAPFKKFSKENPQFYLAHLFSLHAPGRAPQFQLGYYLPGRDRIVVFETDPVEQKPEDEAFNKGGKIKELDLAAVKISPEEAEKAAAEILRQHAPAETVTKVIMVLQHLDTQVYNITLVTMTFNIFNARIDAATGEVLSKEMRSIMSLRVDEKAKK